MITTTYHQTVIDTTGVEEANRNDLLEALERESVAIKQYIHADVKQMLADWEHDEQRAARVLFAIIVAISIGLIAIVHH